MKLVEETAAKLKCDPFKILCLFANGDWKKLGYEAECFFKETETGAVKTGAVKTGAVKTGAVKTGAVKTGAVKMGYVISPDMRLHAAKEACKYLYTQLRSVEINPSSEQKDINKEVEELKKWYMTVRDCK